MFRKTRIATRRHMHDPIRPLPHLTSSLGAAGRQTYGGHLGNSLANKLSANVVYVLLA